MGQAQLAAGVFRKSRLQPLFTHSSKPGSAATAQSAVVAFVSCHTTVAAAEQLKMQQV
jgi:hypothetical protein